MSKGNVRNHSSGTTGPPDTHNSVMAHCHSSKKHYPTPQHQAQTIRHGILRGKWDTWCFLTCKGILQNEEQRAKQEWVMLKACLVEDKRQLKTHMYSLNRLNNNGTVQTVELNVLFISPRSAGSWGREGGWHHRTEWKAQCWLYPADNSQTVRVPHETCLRDARQ